MTTINRQVCPHCGQTVNKRRIALFLGMVESMGRVRQWCKKNGIHEFTRKDIKHLLKNDSQIARFGDWALFGGLAYKSGKGYWGINMQRVDAFFEGIISIPTLVVKDSITKQIVGKEEYRYISGIKGIGAFMDKNGTYIAEYE